MKIAILGYGNIGKAAEEAIKAAPDMQLAGIYHHNDCLDCIDADVVLVCTPTREVQKFATVLAARGNGAYKQHRRHSQHDHCLPILHTPFALC